MFISCNLISPDCTRIDLFLVSCIASIMSATKVLNNFVISARSKNVKEIFRHQFRRSTTAANTMKVAQRLKMKREEALLGGGQKRIDQQHKKVGKKIYIYIGIIQKLRRIHKDQ